MAKGIKVSIPVYINADNGDVQVTVCKSRSDAQKFSDKNIEDGGQSLDGECQTIVVTVDETGHIIAGVEDFDEEDGEDEDFDSDDDDDDDDD